MTERKPKVLVIGPAYVDMAIRCVDFPEAGKVIDGSGFSCVPTGAGVCQAIQAALCGCQTALLARIGEDCFGQMIQQTLHRYEVSCDLLYPTQAISTGIIVTMVDPVGENYSCISAGANRVLGRDEIEYAPAEQYLSTVNVCLISDGVPPSAAVAALRYAKIHHVRTVLEVRLPQPDRNAVHQVDWPADFYNADLILLRFDGLVSSSELGAGWEGELKFISTELIGCGATCVVVSMGWHGALITDRNGHRHVPGVALEVVDHSGSDWAFAGALAASYGCGDTVDCAVRFAVAAEAIATSRFGTLEALPKKSDILMVLHQQPD